MVSFIRGQAEINFISSLYLASLKANPGLRFHVETAGIVAA
jgi:hypothetical protein